MGVCTSKNQIYNNPSEGSENVINLYKKADKKLIIRSLHIAQKFMDDEELKKEYHYVRKLIIVSAFLREMPEIFHKNYEKMKIFLDINRLPSNVYDMIYKYNNKLDTQINKYLNSDIEILDIDNSEENITNSLNIIRSYIYDIILI